MQDIFLLGAKCWDIHLLSSSTSSSSTFDESSLSLQSDIVEGSVNQMNDIGSVMTSAEQMDDMQQSERTVKDDRFGSYVKLGFVSVFDLLEVTK